MSRKKWVAVINGNRWVVAKISRSKHGLTIDQLAELNKTESAPKEDSLIAEQVTEYKGDTAEVKANSAEILRISALKDWLKDNKVPLKKLDIALSCPGVITRMVTLPNLSEKDLEKLLTEQVDQYFTLNISDYVVDYRILERIREDEQERLRVLLVALPLTEWEKQWKLWEELGFAPKVTDFSADCLCRLYQRLSGWGDKDQLPALDLAIVDLGTDRVEFVLVEHGVFFLYSDMEISLEDLTLPDEGLKVPGEIQELANESTESSTEVYEKDLEDRLYPIFTTLSEFLNFFASRHYGKSVDQIFITGECADHPQLEELFEKNMGIRSKVGFPKDWKPKFKKKAINSDDHWMKYGSLYGLAFRED